MPKAAGDCGQALAPELAREASDAVAMMTIHPPCKRPSPEYVEQPRKTTPQTR